MLLVPDSLSYGTTMTDGRICASTDVTVLGVMRQMERQL